VTAEKQKARGAKEERREDKAVYLEERGAFRGAKENDTK